jgi:hypothetical protein
LALVDRGIVGQPGHRSLRVPRILLEFIQDPDENTRQWAVNALAMLGTDDIIDPLLETLGRDPSMVVREGGS